jgi:3-carboxy-cis,cis-muconate cycloisomerase
VHAALAGLEVDADRMRANLDASRGQIMAEALTTALAPRIGRDAAYKLVAELVGAFAARPGATAEGTHLRDVALADERVRAALSPDEIARAFDPAAYLGSTGTFIDRALAGFAALRSAPGTADAEAEHG